MTTQSMPDLHTRATELEYTAPQGVREAIAALGRTEDVRFSPNNRRLAVAAINRNVIAIFEIEVATGVLEPHIALTSYLELSSASLNRPHGLDFIDDETLVVANRKGDVSIYKLPNGNGRAHCEVQPVQAVAAGETSLLNGPAAVSVLAVEGKRCEIVICNNFGNTVTRHVLDLGAGCAVRSSEILLRKWLDIPDGVTVSDNRGWIALSNHNTHSVLVYENTPLLNEAADPDGILSGVSYPHGLWFSADGRHLFVADGGSPYLHVYARDEDSWRRERTPTASIRIMDESVFLRRRTLQSGGPKGIDIDRSSCVLVATSEFQPLAFFDVKGLLELANGQSLQVRGSARRAEGAAADGAPTVSSPAGRPNISSFVH